MSNLRVLFVSSGNSKTGINPIIKRQGESLLAIGCNVKFFTIKGKGIKGYLSNLIRLRTIINNFQPEIIHAHYSMSAFLVALTGAKPIVVSLMGSDVETSAVTRIFIKFFNRFSWSSIIVKSENMSVLLGAENMTVIPNGVNTEIFCPMNKEKCVKELGWEITHSHILFAANPARSEKNYELTKLAFTRLNDKNIKLHHLINVNPEHIPIWINASDVVVLSSLWEGSPNIIKETMSCNRPIVSTNVGDIKWLFGDEPGHFITGFEQIDFSDKIKFALDFSKNYGRTNGRKRIIDLKLEAEMVAKRIIEMYAKVLGANKY